MPSRAARYNRTEEEWEELIEAAIEMLLEQGRMANPTLTYSQFNDLLAERTGQPKFEFRSPQGQVAVGEVLAEVNNRTLQDVEALIGRKALLSVLVMRKGSSDHGGGFYTYARQHGMLMSASAAAKDKFFVQQLKDIGVYCTRIG